MSVLPATVDLTWYRGDTTIETFRLLDGSTPIDLSSATVACWARNGQPGTVVELDASIGSDPGVVTIAPPVDGIAAGHYRYDLEVDDGGQVTTWLRGRLEVMQDITNA